MAATAPCDRPRPRNKPPGPRSRRSQKEIALACTCATSSPPIPNAARRLTAEACGIYLDYSKNRITDETLRLLLELAERVRPARAHRRDVPRRQDQRHRKIAPCCTSRCARRAGASIVRRRRERRAARPRGARQDGRVLQPRPQRRVEGPYRQAHPQRDQHRHRRLRPRSGDGLRGAASTTATAR